MPEPFDLVATASAVVLLSSVEGSPQVLVQAAALGTPFVSFDVDGGRELLDFGASGRVVRIGDLDAAADAAVAIARSGLRGGRIDMTDWDPALIARGIAG